MQVIGEVIAVSGNVHAILGGEDHVLTQGYPIHQGETILTGQGGSVEIKLADDTILAQGENATQTIDNFIFDPANASASSMLVDMAQGTFRMVTGQVGKANPEGVAVKTPLATIGIRGTGIDLDVQGAIAKVGCFLYDGLDVTITTEQGTRFLTAVNTILDILADGTFGEIRSYSDFERAFFSAAVPLLSVDTGTDDGDQQGEGEGGDDTGEGEGDAGEGEPGEGDTGEGDAGEGEVGTPEATLSMEALFEAIFGTPEQPNQALQELFQALTGDEGGNEANDSLAGGEGNDTLEGLGDDDDDDDDDSTLIGGGDDDTLPGDDEGDDTLPGGDEGDDTLPGGDEGDDTLPGDDEGDDTLPGDDEDDEDTTPTGGGGGGGGTPSQGTSWSPPAGASALLANLSEGTASWDLPDNQWDQTSIESTVVEVTGTGTDDTIIGDARNNTLYGQCGNDSITGNCGDDSLLGEAGDDTLDGGDGHDTLSGGSGYNSLVGGAGFDIADYDHSTSGVTVSLVGGTAMHSGGIDTLSGIEGIFGSSYNDSIVGNDQANNLYGYEGDDTLEGGAGDDYLNGGEGDDTLEGGAGDDNLNGGAGNNVLDGGTGVDDASYYHSTSGVTVNLTAGTAMHSHGTDTLSGIEAVHDSGYDDSILGDDQANSLYANAGNDTLSGGESSDTMFGGAGDDYLDGGTGDDELHGDEGDNTLVGGMGVDTADYGGHSTSGVTVNLVSGTAMHSGGTDTLSGIEVIKGSSYGDTIVGDDQANVLYGYEGNDTLSGGDGEDWLYGNAGNDSLDGGNGNDSLDGGEGDDTLSGGAGNSMLDGGAGLDFVDYQSLANDVIVNLAAGTAVHDGVTDTLSGIEGIFGSSYNDSIVGNDQANNLYGYEGSDTLEGGEGDDYLDGGEGDDTLEGGEGDDYLDSGAGNNVLDGGTGVDAANYTLSTIGVTVNLADAEATHSGGTDTLADIEEVYGSDYDDSILGDAQANYLGGYGGNDTLSGGESSDTMFGDAGDDDLDGGDGDDWLYGGKGDNTLVGGAGFDIANYTHSTSGIEILLSDGYGTHSDGYDDITQIEGIYGSSHDDSITGNAEANQLYGFGGDDHLIGGVGNDTLNGGDGNDWLHGDDGDDTLSGGDSDDTLIGGLGADKLTGGLGNDLFKYEDSLQGSDLVTDFVSGSDKFSFLSDGGFSNFSVSYSGAHVPLNANDFYSTNFGTSYDGATGMSGMGTHSYFIFNEYEDKLYYDNNGEDAGGHFLISQVQGDNVLYTDIEIDSAV